MSTDPDRAVTVRPMVQAEFEAFLVVTEREYLADIVRSGGGDEAVAAAKAANDMAGIKRNGPTGARHRTYVVVNGAGVDVGALWLGSVDDWARAWIFDIGIDVEHRGRGLGRAALAAVEEQARTLGATAIGLHVFTFNDVARTLYETSGYVVTETRRSGAVMWKLLPGGSAEAAKAQRVGDD